MTAISIFWHRRDLRLEDNAGLYHALKSGFPVLPLFIFDTEILDELPDKSDARVQFIQREVAAMHARLSEMGSTMLVRVGKPMEVWKQVLEDYDVRAVYTNRDYEPYAISRDQSVRELLDKKGIAFHDFKDHVIFEGDEVLKDDGDPYVVFTPYSRKWKARLDTRAPINEGQGSSFYLESYPNERYFSAFYQAEPLPCPSLQDIGFEPGEIEIPDTEVSRKLIREYADMRDYPAEEGTSRLGIHFRFGTISIREKARKARGLSETYLNELIWRDFYSQILQHFPRVVDEPFYEKYRFIQWINDEDQFEAWKKGQTGYPMVDAGMRELNATGFMHNRVRMVVASFLTKHLLIDWRWGEAYFAEKLLDFDLASNNGGWQWAAGCGTDAAPYFRIFNPESQMKKFDKDKRYIRKWVPEFGTPRYPEPIVDHKSARERCLTAYKSALDEAERQLG